MLKPISLCRAFKNDSKGRLLVKTVPDGGDERYYYDRFGRIRFVVDAVQGALTTNTRNVVCEIRRALACFRNRRSYHFGRCAGTGH